MKKIDGTRRIVTPAHLNFVRADELRVVADLPIKRLEEVGDDELVLRLVSETLERSERLRVSDVALEDRTVALDRLVDLRHLRLAKCRKAKHERDLLLVVGRERELRLEVLGEVAPHALARKERVER